MRPAAYIRAMINVCPHCGTAIQERLVDGLASCVKCNRIFDSSLTNRLLSASWLCRRYNYHGVAELISDTKLPEHEAILVYSFVGENLYSHDEFQKVLKLFGINQKSYIDQSA
jgi:hypothetical protein